MNKIIMTDEMIQIEKELNLLEKFLNELPDKAINLGIRIVLAALIFFIGAKLIRLFRKVVKKSLQKANAETGVVQFMDGLTKISLYFILILLIAENFGIDATSIIALIGSTGITIGFALQGSLSNLAGGILILFLKPFRVGDYIIASDGNEGVVSNISIFYTKLVTIDQKTVVLPNGALANGSITNCSESLMRKIDMRFGISYDADIRRAKQIIEELLYAHENIDKTQPIQIFVHELASSEVTLGVRCFCENAKYWDTKWDITEKVKYAFDAEGIQIPFNQLDVHMK